MAHSTSDTIAAIATPPGRGGVGIVRISGPLALAIGQRVLGRTPRPRHAHYGSFSSAEGELIDRGIALWFPAPHSFTGEDVFELQAHGGPVVLDLLLRNCLALGARLARPGEFSERAYLNDKLDLAQAEAIADLIDSASEQAARSAMRSLQGDFSAHVQALVDQVIGLRTYVEAAIDFPDEEIDFLSDGRVASELDSLRRQLQATQARARQGSLLREGITLVIAGKPNAGKSSLLNALAGGERAIVTDVPGTTRDVLREWIQLDGLPVHIIDTAGLRDTDDTVEKIGVQRAWEQLDQADLILLVVDSHQTTLTDPEQLWPDARRPSRDTDILVIHNKCDLSGQPPGISVCDGQTVARVSARDGHGIDALKAHLKAVVGFEDASAGSFSARRRHLDALARADRSLAQAQSQLLTHHAGELVAEELRYAQLALDEITGRFSSDDLLGEIFSSFCIGK
ncbi:MAG TPA: tRNA uridine-5-carboxymethylaminomethyl(34) synthesis GTPase MnmE [Spongiibacteraceae bacterium]|jgi:tRNA modification GTPase|nr:tRNA uridine-5-carboxymethylaminomethyl(34) synthesis GTPase MnmE [Spongiibacteraceae bacterium]HUH37241.1 tRNA uridine-5-carboxymethylaminomethyl(34) synthesis GTPase MnmE [Spongiibacteraceae bacterium]